MHSETAVGTAKTGTADQGDVAPPEPAAELWPAASDTMVEAPVEVRPCSIAAALEVLGERWSLLAVREMAYGVHRFARIAGFTGASRDILADRLRKLEAAGVVERRQYSEHPPRHEYHLTHAGHELFPLMMALREWGDRWAVDEPAVEFRHTCGEQVELDLRCAHCGDKVTRESLTPSRTR